MLDMQNIRSLVAFVGLKDPYPEHGEDSGPILALLVEAARAGRPFDEAWLLCSGSEFLERALELDREAKDEGLLAKIVPLDFPLKDVIDYAEIWTQLGKSLALIRERAGARPRAWSFLLDSGTPQMKACLFLAARSGLFPATLVQGIPPRFAGGAYKAREVRLEGFPRLSLATALDGAAIDGAVAMTAQGSAAPHAAQAGGADDALGAAPIGASAAFVEALEHAVKAARYEVPVLILGETGTGKTMIARRIHDTSGRRAGPFVEVNCSAIAESLAESEFFGHARGAYSGAEHNRAGKFRAARGGTLFLDEIGDLSPELQAKLLKAIEERRVTPVGSDEAVPVDVRLIAATNRDLAALVATGAFRRDLYERLKVFVIRLPRLAERREDVRLLAEHFLRLWNAQYGERRRLTADALALLEAYAWPGNVRELENALKSAACTSATEAIGPEALPDEIRRSLPPSRISSLQSGGHNAYIELPPAGLNLKARLLQIEWEYVSAALRATDGNAEAAARLLGMTGHAFRKALRERLAGFMDRGFKEGM